MAVNYVKIIKAIIEALEEDKPEDQQIAKRMLGAIVAADSKMSGRKSSSSKKSSWKAASQKRKKQTADVFDFRPAATTKPEDTSAANDAPPVSEKLNGGHEQQPQNDPDR